MTLFSRQTLSRALLLSAVVALAGCAVAQPRTDDPWEHFNRKMYTFNTKVDKVAIRPVAVGYRKVTTPDIRRHVNTFFTNIRLPITIGNDLLQARFKQAAESTGRFVVNMTLGFVGFNDLASQLGIPEDDNDFGVTLAHWGVPEGPYLMLPLMGPSTVRDVWHYPVDSYFMNPLSYYARNHSYKYGQEYAPELVYLVSLRSQAMDAESFLDSAYDPYTFLRDAYRQRRLYKIYYGNPPDSVIERMQGLDQQGFDPDEIEKQQREWEQSHKNQQPANASSSTSG